LTVTQTYTIFVTILSLAPLQGGTCKRGRWSG